EQPGRPGQLLLAEQSALAHVRHEGAPVDELRSGHAAPRLPRRYRPTRERRVCAERYPILRRVKGQIVRGIFGEGRGGRESGAVLASLAGESEQAKYGIREPPLSTTLSPGKAAAIMAQDEVSRKGAPARERANRPGSRWHRWPPRTAR